LEFQRRNPIDNEECNFAFRYYVFGSILSLLDQVAEKNDVQDPGILLRKGICLKGMGNYDDALKIIERASTIQTDNSDILAQLADCYALVGETNLSKVFFREAFFVEPQDISCDFLESEMIQRLFEVVREKIGDKALIANWVPVYGDIYRVFSIKRELRAVEYGKLRQSVYSLEREFANQPEKRELIMPRLLNKYFWIVDHLVSIREDKGRVQEVLLKIRSINPEIFTLYTK
jgi:tetratricopeptide (TPR) repeat protein